MKHSESSAFQAARRVAPRPLSLSGADLLDPPRPMPRAGGWLIAALGAESRVMTPEGPRAAGLIRPGDRLLTLDHGAQPVLWTGRHGVTAAQIVDRPELGAIHVARSAFGPGLPRRALRVSPLAGVLRPFAAAPSGEALIAAADLIDDSGVTRAGAADLSYVQILLPRHGVIGVDGLLFETLHPQRIGSLPMDAGLRAAVAAAMPALDHGADLYGPAVRQRAARRRA